MSRGAVARAIGLEDDQPIYALEKRDSKRSNLAPALAKLFAVSLESLLQDDLTALSAVDVSTTLDQPQTKFEKEAGQSDALLSAFQRLSEDGKLELQRFAQFLLAKEQGKA